MWYVLTDNGIYDEFDNWSAAEALADKLNSRGIDAWICSDDEEPADIDDDFGFDPYEGCYTYDCQAADFQKNVKKLEIRT